MFQFLKRRLKSEKGAMDKILVTLLLVVVGVAAVVGLNQWVSNEMQTVQNAAEDRLNQVINENNAN